MPNVTVLHFWSPTCGPCKTIKPSLEVLKEEFPEATWVSINTKEDFKGVAAQYGVNVVPTLIFFKDGVEVGRHSGASVGIYYTLMRKAFA
jgi:thiol-disulfide isomerase/thioredoxin